MRTVRLSTNSGGFVTTVRVPEMNPPPDAILWGDRLFLHITAEHYSEGMLYIVPPMDVKIEKIPEPEEG